MMKTVNMATLASLVLALAPAANAAPLSETQVYQIRSVLKGIGYPDEVVQNSDLENLRKIEKALEGFSTKVDQYKLEVASSSLNGTCGRGTYGCSR